MMTTAPAVTADQMREVDRLMISEFHIDLMQMMENVKGDLKSTEGEYRFTDLGDGTTELGYETSVEVGGFVPGPVKSMVRELALSTFIREFKNRVEGNG